MQTDKERIGQLEIQDFDISGLMDISGEIEEESRRVEEDKIFVALGKEVKESKSVLSLALKKSGGRKICILHVHQPAQMIALMGGKIPANKLKEQEFKAYRELEKKKMHGTLNEFLSICVQAGVRAEKIYIEMDSIEKGIVELISQYGIKNLIMGAAADKHYSKTMTKLKSKKAIFVCEKAHLSCHIWFVCKEHLIYTRGQKHHLCLSNQGIVSEFEGIEISRRSTSQVSEVSTWSASDVLGTVESNSTVRDEGSEEGTALYSLCESKENLHESSPPNELLLAKASESLYEKEKKQREELEVLLWKEKQELEMLKIQLDQVMEKLQITQEHKSKLESQIADSDQVVAEMEEQICSAMQLSVNITNERDELLRERDDAVKEAKELRKTREEEVAELEEMICSAMQLSVNIRNEQDELLRERDDAVREAKELRKTGEEEVAKLEEQICSAKQLSVNIRNERDELLRERDGAVREAKELRNTKEEEVAVLEEQICSAMQLLVNIRNERDELLRERDDAIREAKELRKTREEEVAKLEEQICSAMQLSVNFMNERDELLRERDDAIREAKELRKTREEEVAELEEMICSAMQLLVNIRNERDELLGERDDAVREAKELRKTREEEVAELEKHFSSAMQLLVNIRNERDELLRERDDAVREAKELRKTREEVVAELEEQIFSAMQLSVNITNERDELLRERDDAVREAKELTKTREQGGASSQGPQFFSKFSFSEIERATCSFDPSMKIGEGGYWIVYRGKLQQTRVAIKMLHSDNLAGRAEFQQEVDVLSRVRHPNLITLIGVCPEAWALIYEFLPNGNLEDQLACKDGTPPLSWQTRIRIAIDVCSALIFLNSKELHSIVDGDLNPTNILLDANFVSKLGYFGIYHLIRRPENLNPSTLYYKTSPNGTLAYMDPEFLSTGKLPSKSDVCSFGIIVLRLLTGRSAVGIVKEVQYALEKGDLNAVLDASAGNWPYVQANQLAHLALLCCCESEMSQKNRPNLEADVWRVLEPIGVCCGALSFSRLASGEYCRIPSNFICPILQEIMQDPHVAADGFTYEAEGLKAWFDGGHDTSPMTNLKLDHLNLIPNHTLRSAIQEWLQQP